MKTLLTIGIVLVLFSVSAMPHIKDGTLVCTTKSHLASYLADKSAARALLANHDCFFVATSPIMIMFKLPLKNDQQVAMIRLYRLDVYGGYLILWTIDNEDSFFYMNVN